MIGDILSQQGILDSLRENVSDEDMQYYKCLKCNIVTTERDLIYNLQENNIPRNCDCIGDYAIISKIEYMEAKNESVKSKIRMSKLW